VTLDESIQGIAEGQSAVFYTPTVDSKDETYICLGGGVITL
jgi:tRNA U34 2-thiouridine synthase MnmA/TrmU